jgi:hypothetical protein
VFLASMDKNRYWEYIRILEVEPTIGMVMKKITMLAAMSLVCLSAFADEAQVTTVAQSMPAADCSAMGSDVQQFAAQLSGQNQRIFCGQFTEVQRATAMQMVGQPDESGNAMSADQSVQKVASTSPTNSQKTPTGCPVK